MKSTPKKLMVFDFETDPFENGRQSYIPFCVGAYSDLGYWFHWGTDSARQVVRYIRELEEEYIIYAHNAGKFDFLFILPEFSGEIKIVNGRVLAGTISGKCEQEMRDSWGIIPEPMRNYKKTPIDYTNFVIEKREKFKQPILDYLKDDVIGLYEWVSGFWQEFGPELTIGGTAMKNLRKFHKFKTVTEGFDAKFRKFFFGGRCQVFQSGIINEPVSVYDLNAAYASVMQKIEHPIGLEHGIETTITKRTDFACIIANNKGALPIRTKTGLSFNAGRGEYFATIHEINAGLETGTLLIERVKHSIWFHRKTNFADFIDHFQEKQLATEKLRDAAKEANETQQFEHYKMVRDFYKRVKNSAYGKFAQDGSEFADAEITHTDAEMPQPEWAWYPAWSNGTYTIWEKYNSVTLLTQLGEPDGYQAVSAADGYTTYERKRYASFFNVATAASITGATRALLLHGLAKSERPFYCDTDSIICSGAFSGELDKEKLGAWKLECEGDSVAIAGKKLYAVNLTPIWQARLSTKDKKVASKIASKGARLTAEQIFRIAKGDTILYEPEAPAFKIGGDMLNMSDTDYIARKIRRTDFDVVPFPKV